MITIADILPPAHVSLTLSSEDQKGGIAEVLGSLQGRPGVGDWDALREAVTARNAPAISCGACGVCIAHGRTNAVQSLVMAAGRSSEGLTSSNISERVRLVFVVGIPAAFQSDYLRIVGTIARLCHDKDLFGALLSAQTSEKFVHLLTRAEVKL